MATTTPNYGWPVPTSTDYVKDGATAIEALGDAIDATVFGLPTAGFTLISSTTFSAVAAASVNNCFSGTYKNYRIVFDQTALTVSGIVKIRLRASGADRTGSVYGNTCQGLDSLANISNLLGTEAYGYINRGVSGNGDRMAASFDVTNPFVSGPTKFMGTSNGYNSNSNPMSLRIGVMYATADVNDGFTIYVDSGTISGTVKVYGYKD